MKKIVYICIALSIMNYGCTKNFDEKSKNPNAIKDASAATLLSQTLYDALVTRIQTAKNVGNELMGYTVQKSERAYTQRFDIRNTLGNNLWNKHYVALTNIEDMYKRAIVEDNVNYQAVALTLKAWVVSELTDTFRDIPYFEATQGDNLNFLPKYDTQEEIYKDLLNNLDKAALLFNNSKAMNLQGDILYGSQTTTVLQVAAWRKFCNSLRLRLYLRVSNVPEFDSPAKINEIVSNASLYPVFANASEQAYIPLTNQEPLYNPYYNSTNVQFGSHFAPSYTILQMMQEISDPRLPYYYEKSLTEYTGVKSGFPAGVAGEIFQNGTSYLKYNLHDSPRLGVIMSYDELQFILAEATLKGWINTGTSAKDYYLQGIRSNMEFWGLTPSSTYLNMPGVVFDDTIETIIKQKYLASFFRGLEAWFDYRRTGYPNLIIDPRADNNAKVPSRLIYPATTQIYNPTNYKIAVERMGGDHINVKSFWEKP